ncbi:hypothetical protein Agabi119p4_8619 [Agaricus bisporus var. burnettii]|uniref:Uncharacterized protein n=1 Tax=Agaricus bisporus var. burnettii TaxID=192524 RepID=A0A8H7EYJ8_AGABI|nr:hypothetical protein Agabi119p4_8619 [Agaricus bisporus var. burnettii]
MPGEATETQTIIDESSSHEKAHKVLCALDSITGSLGGGLHFSVKLLSCVVFGNVTRLVQVLKQEEERA